jgi:amidase
MKATPIPKPGAAREEVVQRALEMIHNTCPFDVVGYPSMSAPCGLSEGLPVGAMLVGGSWTEAKILRAARALEASGSYDIPRPEGVESAR